MTARDKKCCQALLDVLHDLDGGQATETLLHAEVNVRLGELLSLAEFNGVLSACDGHGWLTGVKPKFGTGKKWNINDAGEAARLELMK